MTECPKSSHEPATASEPIVFVSDDASKLPDVARLAIVANTAERECYPLPAQTCQLKSNLFRGLIDPRSGDCLWIDGREQT